MACRNEHLGFWYFLLLSLGLEGGTRRGYYDVKEGATLELSWNLEKGDRTEGGFTVSGGNEEVRFYIKNPYQVVIYGAGIVKSHYSTGFTAGHSGVYSFYFENLESLSDKRLYVTFRSPYEPRFTVFGKPSLLMIVFGGLILVCLMIWSGAKDYSSKTPAMFRQHCSSSSP